MVTCTATQNTLAGDYTALGNWVGLATGAPGSTATASNEASGGAPAYARVQGAWGAAAISGASSTAQFTAGVTINVNSGTYTYAILASASTATAANMFDNCSITSVTMSAQGQIVVTPAFSLS